MNRPPPKNPSVIGPLLALAASGMSAWWGYRWYRDEVRRIGNELKDAERALDKRAQADAETLQKDPTTGVYRPGPKHR